MLDMNYPIFQVFPIIKDPTLENMLFLGDPAPSMTINTSGTHNDNVLLKSMKTMHVQ